MTLGTNMFWGMKGLDGESLNQRIGSIGFSSGDFGFMYENDGGKGISDMGLGDKGDSYRSAALSFRLGDYSAGFNLFTGYRGRDNQTEEIKEFHGYNKKGKEILKNPIVNEVDSFGRKHKYGFVNETGPKYRLGALYVGYKGLRLGVNSEHIRHAIQNRVVHNAIHDRAFTNTSWDWKPYFGLILF